MGTLKATPTSGTTPRTAAGAAAMTPSEARAAFLWGLTTPQQVMAAASTPQLRRDAAERLGVSLRTVQRHAGERLPCPGPRCLTLVRGGGLCSFCRKP